MLVELRPGGPHVGHEGGQQEHNREDETEEESTENNISSMDEDEARTQVTYAQEGAERMEDISRMYVEVEDVVCPYELDIRERMFVQLAIRGSRRRSQRSMDIMETQGTDK